MRRSGRSLPTAILLLVGCADATFELLPLPPAPVSAAGRGGDAGAGTAGMSSGGLLAGMGGGMSGGGGAQAMSGAGTCGPGGCFPLCPPGGCECALDRSYDKECPSSTPFCVRGRCVECLAYNDCPFGSPCGCTSNQVCEGNWNRCLSRCGETRDCPLDQSCDKFRNFCIECGNTDDCDNNPRRPLCFGPLGRCVECESPFDCKDEDAPICDFGGDFSCHPCQKDFECGMGRSCRDGRCVGPGQQDSPDP